MIASITFFGVFHPKIYSNGKLYSLAGHLQNLIRKKHETLLSLKDFQSSVNLSNLK